MTPNIYDIARQAGVSITTVSHALSGRGRVAPATRERVLRAAEEAGYTANRHAQSLVAGRSWTVAIQIAGLTLGGKFRPLLPDAAYFMDLLNGAASAATEHDHALILAPHDLTQQQVQRLALDGAIIVDPTGDEMLAATLADRNLPVVTTGRPTVGPSLFPWVDSDHTSTAIRMFEHFHGQGYTTPALLTTKPTASYVVDIHDAYMRWTAEHDVEPHVVLVAEPATEEAAARAARKLLRAFPHVDVIYASYDRIAVGVLLEARRLGIEVPAELGLASAVDGDVLRLMSPTVTAVSLNPRRIGRKAVEALNALHENRATAESGIVVPARIVARGSTSRRMAASPGLGLR